MRLLISPNQKSYSWKPKHVEKLLDNIHDSSKKGIILWLNTISIIKEQKNIQKNDHYCFCNNNYCFGVPKYTVSTIQKASDIAYDVKKYYTKTNGSKINDTIKKVFQ